MALDPIVTSNSSARRWTERISNALKKEVAIDLNLLPPVCVLQVPKTLSDQKPEAYTPQLIGMGPYHHLRPDLYQMERYKLAAIKEILEPAQILNFKHLLIDKLRENDLVVRACHNRFMDIDEETLAWIVAIDGLFLLNILRSSYDNVHDHQEIIDTIFTRDLMMLENQIPFFVLKQIRKFLCLSSPEDREDSELVSMFRRFCEMHSPLALPTNDHSKKVQGTQPFHLLDLMYRLILNDRVDYASIPMEMPAIIIKHDNINEEEDDGDHQDRDTHGGIIHNFETILEVVENIGPRNVQKIVKPIDQVVANMPWSTISGLFRKGTQRNEDKENEMITIPSASRLWHCARIRCSPIHEGISRIKFEQAASTLYLPVITVNAGSEVILRNLVIYEAAMSKSKLEFARYINLMNGIADTAENVRLLKQNGVIKGDLTDNEVACLFSTMQMSFVRSSRSSNVEIAMEEVNKYYDQMLIVRAHRGLKKNIYLSWKFLTAALSISVVLLLIFQTFCSLYGCHNVWGNRK
ncbi:putative UPF0481 protein At3g02645 [Nicotiana tabacum]|uniref:UPF0481 protein At3g02645 n=1 Tax=Nicotiana tabacum TaxID=4097 RepID=A0A1S3YAC9_TOBAC|nr:putative UPF0481 protein At3g02645 [Nicotiana tomentosiformis]XP_016449059.1 PREDICTED: putative UPF0481 protein At3g02645 [Nicotiana tabacum]